MPVTVHVKSNDLVVRAKREEAARLVLGQFGDRLPELKLLAFLDDEDWHDFRRQFGPANRGLYRPIKYGAFANPSWPPYVVELILVDDPASWNLKQAFDHIIYLYGSTCADETGVIMTFAHELQHFIQYGHERTLWAANSLLPDLPNDVVSTVGLRWFDIPVEREARSTAKRIAVLLCGANMVTQYIDRKINENVTTEDVEDWRLIQDLNPAIPYDLEDATRLIFQRLSVYKLYFAQMLQDLKDDPDFKDIDLDALCSGAGLARQQT